MYKGLLESERQKVFMIDALIKKYHTICIGYSEEKLLIEYLEGILKIPIRQFNGGCRFRTSERETIFIFYNDELPLSEQVENLKVLSYESGYILN